jgi:hypothetical protein
LEASFDLEPIGRSLPRTINTVLSFRDYPFHTFLFSKLEECLSFGFYIASGLNASRRFENPFEMFPPF